VRPSFVACLLLFALTSADAGAQGISLHWDDCGAAGASVKVFACDTNAGSDVLVSSFVAPAGIVDFDGLEVSMQVVFPTATGVPSWWTVPGCRGNGTFSVSANFVAGPFTCSSPWSINAAGAFLYEPTLYLPWVGRLRTVFAVPPSDARPLTEGTEYYAHKFIINHSRTVGPGACAGCEIPAGIILRQMFLDQLTGSDVTLSPPSPPDHSVYVGWQCDGTPQMDHGTIQSWDFVNCAVPARRPTWGAIKSLYR